MLGVNKSIILGRVGKQPEQKSLSSGTQVTSFSVATSEKWRDKSTNEQQEKTEWHNIVCWGKLAEIAGKYVNKGGIVYIEGKSETRSWDDKDGNKKYRTEIIARELQMIGGKKQGDDKPVENTAPLDMEDDLPF